MRLLRNLACGAGLLHDQVRGMSLDDSLELGLLVSGEHEKPAGLGTCSPVRLRVDGELLGALGVGALAEEDRCGSRLAVALLEACDVLVDLPEESLVPRGPLLPQ